MLAVLAQLALPLLHQVVTSAHSGAALTSHGVAFSPADPSEQSPRGCTLCDALAQGRRSFGAPCAELDPSSPHDLAATAAPCDPGTPRSVERSACAARAPPVRSVSA